MYEIRDFFKNGLLTLLSDIAHPRLNHFVLKNKMLCNEFVSKLFKSKLMINDIILITL